MAEMKWVLDNAALEAIAKGPKAREYALELAEEAHAAAVAVFWSQSRHDPHATGAYLAGLHAVMTLSGARLVASDGKWHWVEFGAHADGKTYVLGYHVLSRALDAIAEAHT